MKARLKYLAPWIVLVAFHAILWALGAEASHLSVMILAVGGLVIMNFLFNAQRDLDRAREEHEHSLQREISFYSYARRVFNAQSAVIARLQARLYTRNRS